MKTRTRRIWTAVGIAAFGYLSAATAGAAAGAAFVTLLAIGVLGEMWMWGELLRGWLTRRA